MNYYHCCRPLIGSTTNKSLIAGRCNITNKTAKTYFTTIINNTGFCRERSLSSVEVGFRYYGNNASSSSSSSVGGQPPLHKKSSLLMVAAHKYSSVLSSSSSFSNYQHNHTLLSNNNTNNVVIRRNSSSSSNDNITPNNSNNENKNENNDDDSTLLYEGPMGPMITPLKLMSVSTASLSLTALPLLLYSKSDIMSVGQQFAFGGVSMMTSIGTTLILHYIFSPYAYKIEKVLENHDDVDTDSDSSNSGGNHDDATTTSSSFLVKATTINIFTFQKSFIFNPHTDVVKYDGLRPFCNFLVTNKDSNTTTPLYVHPGMLDDNNNIKFLGLIPGIVNNIPMMSPEEENQQKKNKSNDDAEDDDELFLKS